MRNITKFPQRNRIGSTNPTARTRISSKETSSFDLNKKKPTSKDIIENYKDTLKNFMQIKPIATDYNQTFKRTFKNKHAFGSIENEQNESDNFFENFDNIFEIIIKNESQSTNYGSNNLYERIQNNYHKQSYRQIVSKRPIGLGRLLDSNKNYNLRNFETMENENWQREQQFPQNPQNDTLLVSFRDSPSMTYSPSTQKQKNKMNIIINKRPEYHFKRGGVFVNKVEDKEKIQKQQKIAEMVRLYKLNGRKKKNCSRERACFGMQLKA